VHTNTNLVNEYTSANTGKPSYNTTDTYPKKIDFMKINFFAALRTT